MVTKAGLTVYIYSIVPLL